MMLSVLRQARVAAQATIAKQVDQDLPPHPEDAAHAINEAGHLPPHLVVLPLPPQDAATLCSPTPRILCDHNTQAQGDAVCPS